MDDVEERSDEIPPPLYWTGEAGEIVKRKPKTEDRKQKKNPEGMELL